MAVYTATVEGSGAGGLQTAFNSATAANDEVFINTAALTLTAQHTWTAAAGAKLYGLGTESANGGYGGGDLTIISDNYNAADSIAIVITAAGAIDVKGITFSGGTATGEKPLGNISIFGGGYGIHVHHCTWNMYYVNVSSTGGGSIRFGGKAAGVIDHCIFNAGRANDVGPRFNNGEGYDALLQGDTAWTMPTYRGQDGLNYYMVMEDCQNNDGYATDADGGARYVYRFNTYASSSGNLQNHSTGSGGRNRGGRAMEIYANHFSAGSGTIPNTAIYLTGGTGYYWENYCPSSTSPDTGFKNFVQLHTNRTTASTYLEGPPNGGSSGNYWGYAGAPVATGTVNTVGTAVTLASGSNFSTSWFLNQLIIIDGHSYAISSVASTSALTLTGSSVHSGEPADPGILTGKTYYFGSNWDGNTDATGYPVLDMVGRGSGDLIVNDFPTAQNQTTGTVHWPNQALEPVRIWNNAWTAVPHNPGVLVSLYDWGITLLVDYYTDETSGGITSGTTLPGLATDGDAFWKTDEGSWNAGTNSNYTGQGVLYVRAAGSWGSPYYIPLEYPHPLTQGVTPAVLHYTMA